MYWRVIGRELGLDEVHVIDWGLPCKEDADYLATEYQEYFGGDWVMSVDEMKDGASTDEL